MNLEQILNLFLFFRSKYLETIFECSIRTSATVSLVLYANFQQNYLDDDMLTQKVNYLTKNQQNINANKVKLYGNKYMGRYCFN